MDSIYDSITYGSEGSTVETIDNSTFNDFDYSILDKDNPFDTLIDDDEFPNKLSGFALAQYILLHGPEMTLKKFKNCFLNLIIIILFLLIIINNVLYFLR